MTDADNTIRVFCSYAHDDDRLREKLATQLIVLQRSRKIGLWSDHDITGGHEWHARIKDELAAAHLVLLLVSPSFLASLYINEVELDESIRRHEAGDLRVVPIILEPCLWQEDPRLKKLQALPTRARPVSKWRRVNDAMHDVATGLNRVIDELREHRGPDAQRGPDAPPSPTVPAAAEPASPPPAGRASPAESLADYLGHFRSEWQHVAGASLDPDAADPRAGGGRVELDHVYVGLNVLEPNPEDRDEDMRPDRTGIRPERERAPWTALDACRTHARCVLLGDPGAGKSTFLRRLALSLADGFRETNGAAGPQPFGRPLLPILVTLRDLAQDLGPATDDDAVRIPKFVARTLAARDLEEDASPFIRRLLRDGDAILLLDGLDEIANADHRAAVLDSIRAFAGKHPKTRIVVTCRVAAYRDFDDDAGGDGRADDWRLPRADYPVVTLAPFTTSQMHEFIGGWYRELSRTGKMTGDPEATAGKLCRALERSDIARLASNPLLLTVMTYVHAKRGELPDERVVLYEQAVDTLLRTWRSGRDPNDENAPPGVIHVLDEARCPFTELEAALWRIAERVHGKTAGQTRDDEVVADIAIDDLVAELRSLHPHGSLPWTGSLIEAITFRSGLLLERKRNVFTFPHRTFQEYLAARELASRETFVSNALELRSAPNDLWREVILLAAGAFSHLFGQAARVRTLIEGLLDAGDDAAAILAADVAREATVRKLTGVAGGRDMLDRLRSRLLDDGMFGDGDIRARAAFGSALGRMGDRRPGVATLDEVRSPAFWSDPIPAAPFPMGNDEPRFDCRLIEHTYAVSRHLVTVGQYRAFIDAGGYDRRWTDAGRAWRDQNRIRGPEAYADVFQTPNHPQVGVSWYEAVAFCDWLAAESGLPIRLPTEPEWERAARHDDAREFPWVRHADPGHADPDAVRARANVLGAIDATTAVGLYPPGRAECGALDMAGNAWEWCETKWTNDYKDYPGRHDADREGDASRVLRGGSWIVHRAGARCAYRGRRDAHVRSGGAGFRLCVSPFSPSDL